MIDRRTLNEVEVSNQCTRPISIPHPLTLGPYSPVPLTMAFFLWRARLFIISARGVSSLPPCRAILRRSSYAIFLCHGVSPSSIVDAVHLLIRAAMSSSCLDRIFWFDLSLVVHVRVLACASQSLVEPCIITVFSCRFLLTFHVPFLFTSNTNTCILRMCIELQQTTYFFIRL